MGTVTMGTWGIKTFENDGTSDWLWELEVGICQNQVIVASRAPKPAGRLVGSPMVSSDCLPVEPK